MHRSRVQPDEVRPDQPATERLLWERSAAVLRPGARGSGVFARRRRVEAWRGGVGAWRLLDATCGGWVDSLRRARRWLPRRHRAGGGPRSDRVVVRNDRGVVLD